MDYGKALKEYWREAVLLGLVTANVAVWVAVSHHRPGPLKVAFLDVGQGDAIFVETPTHKRLLLDGGRNKGVLAELGRLMPFGAKKIDILIESHPDGDHIGGLPAVLERYRVGAFIEPGVASNNLIDDAVHALVSAREIPDILARRGMAVNFGDGAKLLILFPNQDVSRWETNDASIVAKLVYGETSFLLTGDSPIKAENILLKLDPKILDSDVLKAGHHGSRTSSSAAYVAAVSPAYAIISAGKDNPYGHPHKEVLEILTKAGAEIKSTAESGTIRFESDGEELRLR
jgi:competence protein ComEC